MKTDSLTILHAVMTGEAWNFADALGFHHVEKYHQAPSGAVPYCSCNVDGLEIAVFIEMPVPAETRAILASRKPDPIDALVCARVTSNPLAATAVIEGQILAHENAEPQACAFASACVAFNLGLLQAIPESYRVTFADQPAVRVSMDFDDDTESWFGEAAIEL